MMASGWPRVKFPRRARSVSGMCGRLSGVQRCVEMDANLGKLVINLVESCDAVVEGIGIPDTAFAIGRAMRELLPRIRLTHL